jgi:hypothetical protein
MQISMQFPMKALNTYGHIRCRNTVLANPTNKAHADLGYFGHEIAGYTLLCGRLCWWVGRVGGLRGSGRMGGLRGLCW